MSARVKAGAPAVHYPNRPFTQAEVDAMEPGELFVRIGRERRGVQPDFRAIARANALLSGGWRPGMHGRSLSPRQRACLDGDA